MKTEQITLNTPFEMPPLSIPNFSEYPQFNILDFGAKQGESQHLKEGNNNAIADAILAANKARGGTVFIPKGIWLCGKIHLKSYVDLHLAEGATLLFSEDPQDYLPAVKTTWEGMECYNYSPLIYAYHCQHIAISGKGKLKAKLDVWAKWYERPKAHMDALASLYHMSSKGVDVSMRQMVYKGANLRPHFVQFNRCKHVLVEDISIEDSPFWVLHPFLCQHVVIRRVKVKANGHNNDGVDPEMTQNMLIEDCTFEQGDDALAVKSGRNHDAWRLNTPTRNLVMRHCFIKKAHHLAVLGSELSGGIENVLIEHCQLDEVTDYEGAGHLLFIKTNERRGGIVKNIYMQNIQAVNLSGAVLSIETDVLYQWRTLVPTYERRLTQITGIYLKDIKLESANYLSKIEGQKEAPIRNVYLENIALSHIKVVDIDNTHVINFTQR